MTKEAKKIVDIETANEKTPEEFKEAYAVLIQEYGYAIVSAPSLKPRDDGTFSIVVENRITKLSS